MFFLFNDGLVHIKLNLISLNINKDIDSVNKNV